MSTWSMVPSLLKSGPMVQTLISSNCLAKSSKLIQNSPSPHFDLRSIFVFWLSETPSHMLSLQFKRMYTKWMPAKPHMPWNTVSLDRVRNRQETSWIPSRKCNNLIWASVYCRTFLNIWEAWEVLKLRNSNLSYTNFENKFSMSPKFNSIYILELLHRGKQQLTVSLTNSPIWELFRNLQWLLSRRLSRGAVLI